MSTTNIIPLVSPKTYPRISVIMVSYMTGPALLEAVSAILEDPDIYEIILVDNGNTPSARHSLSKMVMAHDKVRLLQGHGNVGFSKACNYGACLASGDYFLFLNPDAILRPMAAKKLADCGQGLTRPWVAGGLLRNLDGQEQKGSRRRALTPWSAFVTFTGLHKLPFFKPIHMEDEDMPAGPTPVPVVSGAFLMTDLESFEMINGFDERYFLHVEDIDFCRRAGAAGGDVYFVPSATVMHYGSTSRVPRIKVEWEKLQGFITYFWNYSGHWLSKPLTLMAMPFMAAAIMGRASWLTIRAGFTGR